MKWQALPPAIPGEVEDGARESEAPVNSFESGGETETAREEAQQDNTDYSIAAQSGNETLDGSSQLSDNGELEESSGTSSSSDARFPPRMTLPQKKPSRTTFAPSRKL